MLEHLINEITQELRIQENYLLPPSPVGDFLPLDGAESPYPPSSVSSGPSSSNSTSTNFNFEFNEIDSESSGSNLPETDKITGLPHPMLLNGRIIDDQEKEIPNGLGLFMPPFTPSHADSCPKFGSSPFRSLKVTNPRNINISNISNKLSNPLADNPIPLPPLPLSESPPISPYKYHRTSAAHLKLPP